MKILLTTNGSRGDVQPILALACELQALGQQALICAAPNFQTWVESYGVSFVPIGPDLEKWTRPSAPNTGAAQIPQKPTPEQLRQLARMSVIDQFQTLAQVAQGCNLIVACGILQFAARSVAEMLNIPYVYAAYAPSTLPSRDLPPSKMGQAYSQSLSAHANCVLWKWNNRSFNRLFLAAVNEQRETLGLSPVKDTSRYITTDHPWLAADAVLGPAATPIDDMHVTQTGAWMLNNSSPLPDPLEQFLGDGEPPLYLGFGSMRTGENTSQVLIKAARELGYRTVISQGWGRLDVIDGGDDCLSIGDVDHHKLFPRVAAIAHHGGAGTTATAARAGRPQVIVPHVYDQYYWAHRVQTLGVGVVGGSKDKLTVESLVDALREALKPETIACAQALASRIEPNGAYIAAERIMRDFA